MHGRGWYATRTAVRWAVAVLGAVAFVLGVQAFLWLVWVAGG